MAHREPNCTQTPPHSQYCSCATPPVKEWAIIGRGLAGWHAEGQDGNTTSSGGNIDNYTYWTGQRCYGYAAEAIDGCLVYDAKDADPVAFSRFVISGPMVNPALPPEGVDSFTAGDREAAARMLPALEGSFQTIATMAQAKTYSGLDRVGLGIYRRLLAQVPGVRFGTVQDGIVIWDAAAPTLTDAPFSLTPEADQPKAHQTRLFNGTE